MQDVATLRTGFEEGLYSRDEVHAWVDREVASRSELPAALLELATIAHRRDDEVLALLGELQGSVQADRVARAQIAALAELYRRERLTPWQVVARLDSIASFREGLSDAERSAILGIVAEVDQAQYFGEIQASWDLLRAFLLGYPLETQADVR